ncbi:MAG: hypothetical protein ACYTBJ_24060 [Planctomycetota bacterium]|jgi:hypothetical protein
MSYRIVKVVALVLAGLFVASCFGQAHSKEGRSPLDELPAWITRVTHFGQRADWSHDGKRILFLAKTFGDVYEVEVATKIIRPMTHHYYHEGYTRALYLSNGDILLSGARKFDVDNARASRDEKNAELWVLKNYRFGRELQGRAGGVAKKYAYRLGAGRRVPDGRHCL